MSRISFYDCTAWRKKRSEILKKYNGECQLCKARGAHSKAVIVHHVFHLDRFPEWGLCEFTEDGQRNLLPVCRDCHETVCHPERMQPNAVPRDPLTVERW